MVVRLKMIHKMNWVHPSVPFDIQSFSATQWELMNILNKVIRVVEFILRRLQDSI